MASETRTTPPWSLPQAARHGLVARTVQQFARNRGAELGLVLIVLAVLTAIASPVLAPHNPVALGLAHPFAVPSVSHPLGTDELGRDILSRLIWGSRYTLVITGCAVAVALAAGTFLGVVAGFRGGLTDTLIMRAMDVLLAMPGFLLALVIIASLGVGLTNIIIAVGINSIPAFARIARSSTLTVIHLEYVLAAQSLGSREGHIMWRHVLPNITAPLLVQTTLRLATAILTASGLSFLGLGVQPPTPEWGAMLSTGRGYITSSPQLVVIPGIAIMLVTVAFNMLGDGLRDALDPRMKT